MSTLWETNKSLNTQNSSHRLLSSGGPRLFHCHKSLLSGKIGDFQLVQMKSAPEEICLQLKKKHPLFGKNLYDKDHLCFLAKSPLSPNSKMLNVINTDRNGQNKNSEPLTCFTKYCQHIGAVFFQVLTSRMFFYKVLACPMPACQSLLLTTCLL